MVYQRDGNQQSTTVAYTYNVSSLHSVIRVVDLDTTNVWSNGEVSVRQLITYNPGPEFDVTNPHVDVNRKADILLSGTISGEQTYASLFYAGQQNQGPLGALTYPPIVWQEGNSTYYFPSPLVYDYGANLWQDFAGSCIDQEDGETFHMIGQVPNPKGFFSAPDVNSEWTTSTGTVQITNAGFCKPLIKVKPKAVYINYDQEARYAQQHPVPMVPSSTATALAEALAEAPSSYVYNRFESSAAA